MDSLLEPRKTSYKNCPGLLRLNIFPQKASTVGPPYLLWVSHPWIQPTSEKNIGENIFESSKKQNLNWWHGDNCLHSILHTYIPYGVRYEK